MTRPIMFSPREIQIRLHNAIGAAKEQEKNKSAMSAVRDPPRGDSVAAASAAFGTSPGRGAEGRPARAARHRPGLGDAPAGLETKARRDQARRRGRN
jgi:hypothetical protein